MTAEFALSAGNMRYLKGP